MVPKFFFILLILFMAIFLAISANDISNRRQKRMDKRQNNNLGKRKSGKADNKGQKPRRQIDLNVVPAEEHQKQRQIFAGGSSSHTDQAAGEKVVGKTQMHDDQLQFDDHPSTVNRHQQIQSAAKMFDISPNAIAEFLNYSSPAASPPSPQFSPAAVDHQSDPSTSINLECYDDYELDPDYVKDKMDNDSQNMEWKKIYERLEIKRSGRLNAYSLALVLSSIPIITIEVDVAQMLQDTTALDIFIDLNSGTSMGCELLGFEDLAGYFIDMLKDLKSRDEWIAELVNKCAKITEELSKNGETSNWMLNKKLWNLHFYALLYELLGALLKELEPQIKETLHNYYDNMTKFVAHVSLELKKMLDTAKIEKDIFERQTQNEKQPNREEAAEHIVAIIKNIFCRSAEEQKKQQGNDGKLRD